LLAASFWLFGIILKLASPEAKTAKALYYRFHGTDMGDVLGAEAEIQSHFNDLWSREPKDKAGRFLLDWLVPEVKIPAANHVVDLTAGRPDTLAWLILMLITQRGQLYYKEYFPAVESKISVLGLQKVYSPTLGKMVKMPTDRNKYQRVIGVLRRLIEKLEVLFLE
jgi:hypothetical protein